MGGADGDGWQLRWQFGVVGPFEEVKVMMVRMAKVVLMRCQIERGEERERERWR